MYYLVWNSIKSNSHIGFHFNHLFPFINSSFSTCMSFYFFLNHAGTTKKNIILKIERTCSTINCVTVTFNVLFIHSKSWIPNRYELLCSCMQHQYSMKVNVLGLIYIIKKLRVSGTRGMRQGGRLKMCSPHRLIMKERNFSEF